jgi:proline racemase
MDIRKLHWQSPRGWASIRSLEMHTGGEPLRVIIDGLPEIKGNTILEKRRFFSEHYDHIRTGLMWEPRGHADMYGAVLTDPVTPDGDFGVFFMHNQGYSTMCGHATIALTKLVLETGMVKKAPGEWINIDGPAGRLLARATYENGAIVSTSFRNVPSFVLLLDEKVEIPGLGRINFDVAFGGAFYAFCEARDLGIDLDQRSYHQLIDYGRRIKKTVSDNFAIRHPVKEDLGFLYGAIITGDPYDYTHHSRNVCIFADGEVDRSATGSGVSARAALHYARKELLPGKKITIESIIGTTMDVEIVDVVKFAGYTAVVPEVTGTSYITGTNEFWFDPVDPLKKGFFIR